MDVSPTAYSLGIDQLPVDDRLRLIGEIWDTIPAESEIELTPEFRAELDRRLAEADANSGAGVPWKEAMARLRSRQ